MAIATSTAILIGAGVAAAGTAASAKMQSSANNKATAAQTKQTDAALGYQRDKDSLDQKRYDQQWQDYQQRHAAWEARNFGAKGGGPQIGSGPGQMGTMHGVPAMAPGQLTPLGGAPSGSMQGATLADLMSGAPPDVTAAPAGLAAEGAMPQQGASLADLARWSDHRNYLGG